jgi:hypothetical protein
VSAISSTLPAGAPSSTPNAFSELSSEEFIRIIFTELQNQDPLQPNDSAALLDQMSSLRSIQSDIELSNKIESLVTQNQLSSAGNLIGQFVSGLAFGNQRASGWVVSISRTADGPVLNLNNGFRVPFDNIDEIVDGDLFEPVDDGTDGPGGSGGSGGAGGSGGGSGGAGPGGSGGNQPDAGPEPGPDGGDTDDDLARDEV